MPEESEAGPSRRQFTAVSLAFFTSSGLGLVLLVVIARWLSPADNAKFLAIWGLLFTFGSALASVEPEVARQATVATLQQRRVPRSAVDVLFVSALATVAVLGVVLLAPQAREILQDSVVLATLVLTSVVGFAAQSLVRGVTLGRNDLLPYAGVILSESVIRLAGVGVALLAGVGSALAAAVLVTVLGCYGWALAAHRVFPRIAWRSSTTRWYEVSGTVGYLMAANSLAALMLMGFPTVATLVIGRPDQLATLFAVVVLARSPLVLLAPVQALVVPVVVRWVRAGQARQLGVALRRLLFGTAAAAAAAAVVGALAGPPVLAVVLGPGYRTTGSTIALVLAATCALAAALIQAAVLVALERRRRLVTCWAASVTTSGLLMWLLPWQPEARGTAGLVGGACVAMAATAIAIRTLRLGESSGRTAG